MPSDIIRRSFRFSTQPFDVPPGGGDEAKAILDMVGADDIFLFASDHPHWQYDGEDPFPPGLPPGLREKIAGANPLATYPRLKGAAA